MINVVYIGNLYQVAEFIYHSDDFSLAAVICEYNRQSDEIYNFCVVRDIPLSPISDVTRIAEVCTQCGVRTGIMCSFGMKLPVELLERIDIYNIHYSALPDYKGRHPTFYAIINNEKTVGITLHSVIAEIDCGPIIARELIANYLWNNEEQLFDELTRKIPQLLDTLGGYLRGALKAQPNSPGSYFNPVSDALTSIDLQLDTPQAIFNKVKAQHRYGGCRLVLEDGVEIIASEVLFVDPASIIFSGAWFHDRDKQVIYAKKTPHVLKISAFENIKGLA
jgi:methionyl-tRNA formyltransferase